MLVALQFLMQYAAGKILDEGIEKLRRNFTDDIFVQFLSSLDRALESFSKFKGWEYDINAVVETLSHKDSRAIKVDIEFLQEVLLKATGEQVSKEEAELWVDYIFTEISQHTELCNYLIISHIGKSISREPSDPVVKQAPIQDINEFLSDNSFGHLERIQRNAELWEDIKAKNQTLTRIQQLNEYYSSGYSYICGSNIPRTEAAKAVEKITSKVNIVIHGNAGVGKSGVIEEIISSLKKIKIPYLAIKLDTRIPNNNAKQFGSDLGLHLSPLDSLTMLYPTERKVLIFDQLDALRWSSAHSGTALEVCSDLIQEADYYNKLGYGYTTLIFASRTTDLNSDPKIKTLFSKPQVKFEQLEVLPFEETVVEKVTDHYYGKFSKKLAELLRTPINLDIWTRLPDESKGKEFSSTYGLVMEYWNIFAEKHIENSKFTNEHEEVIYTIIEYMQETGLLSIPKTLVSKFPPEIIKLLQSAHIIMAQNAHYIFTHQIFYDCFTAREMMDKYYKNSPINEILGDKAQQTPTLRYQVLIFLQHLQQTDINAYVRVSDEMLQSQEVRFYMKYCVLETLNTLQTVEQPFENFLRTYLENPRWTLHFLSAVFTNNVPFTNWLIETNLLDEYWEIHENQVLSLLSSISKSSAGLTLITSFLKTKSLQMYKTGKFLGYSLMTLLFMTKKILIFCSRFYLL